jgi:Multiubiquitin
MANENNPGHGGGNPGQGGGDGNQGHGHTVTIIVEGIEHEWPKDLISYDEVVTLEVPDYPQHQEITYSVKYKQGHGNKPEDTLAKGESVRVKDGMIFSVSETGQS